MVRLLDIARLWPGLGEDVKRWILERAGVAVQDGEGQAGAANAPNPTIASKTYDISGPAALTGS